MNGKEFLDFHQKTIIKMHDVCEKKDQDYSGGANEDAFNNFKMVEKMGTCTVEQGFITRMTDKLMRISNITKLGKQAVMDESVQDTLMDLANYSILFMGYLESKKPKPVPHPKMSTQNKTSEPLF